MNQSIVGYLHDAEGHWVARLCCGHNQHVRHNPPWQNRSWVTTEAGRKKHLGCELDCKKCDRGENKDG